ncbi:helix-turn-helix transcriptional regulator [Plantactinospora sp. KLBMP9567]|uniref:helix-turn-helix domain-containing protein n=1 Tax=Plantactinospora sp. KLBMP9567 TaxID=3085900 RepID=UPI00298244EB|nr:helix-turn-helix transcriptional regulator [Plantactinospora sp. KLBMP9567]MDW5323528.1 helix-turn-helix transcriptional regulator [Plantactinospora sp. KLBMP9567]
MPISPTARRRRLGIELRRLREREQLTLLQVAQRMKCSDAKISRIEAGKHSTRTRDVLALLDIYRVADERTREVLATLAKQSTQRGWWVTYGGAIPDWFEVYVGLESEATEIRTVETHLVPGLLQTEAYAAALIRSTQPLAPAEELTRQVELRLARQRRLQEHDPMRLRVVLGEAVLRCRVGDEAIMRDQLGHLAVLAERSHVELRVVRFSSPAYTAFGRAFAILGFPEPTDPGLVYTEHRTGALYIDEPAQIASFALAFDHLVAAALSRKESARLLRETAAFWT